LKIRARTGDLVALMAFLPSRVKSTHALHGDTRAQASLPSTPDDTVSWIASHWTLAHRLSGKQLKPFPVRARLSPSISPIRWGEPSLSHGKKVAAAHDNQHLSGHVLPALPKRTEDAEIDLIVHDPV
jgi:hypothetical protein